MVDGVGCSSGGEQVAAISYQCGGRWKRWDAGCSASLSSCEKRLVCRRRNRVSGVSGEADSLDTLGSGLYTSTERVPLPCETGLGHMASSTTPRARPGATSSVPSSMLGKGPLLERVSAAVGNPAAHWEKGGASALRQRDGGTLGDHRRGGSNHRTGGLEEEGVIDHWIGAPSGAQSSANDWGRRRWHMARQRRSFSEKLGGHLRGHLVVLYPTRQAVMNKIKPKHM